MSGQRSNRPSRKDVVANARATVEREEEEFKKMITPGATHVEGFARSMHPVYTEMHEYNMKLQRGEIKGDPYII